MTWQTWLLIFALIAFAAFHVISKQKGSGGEEQGSAEEAETFDYSKSYQAKYLLTRNEWHEYKKLKDLAKENDLYICPKVRVLDIIEPRKGQENYRALINKVQSKHVDFLITDQDLRIKGIVELDDNTHDRTDRQERDKFVDEILTSVGYKVVHTRSITETTLDCFSKTSEIQS